MSAKHHYFEFRPRQEVHITNGSYFYPGWMLCDSKFRNGSDFGVGAQLFHSEVQLKKKEKLSRGEKAELPCNSLPPSNFLTSLSELFAVPMHKRATVYLRLAPLQVFADLCLRL